MDYNYPKFWNNYINDYSIDKTYHILLNIKTNENRIKLLNHNKSLGIYHSRVGNLNSSGKYTLFLD